MKRLLTLLSILIVFTCSAIDVKKIVTSTMTSGGSFTCTSTSQNQILKLSGSPNLLANYTVIADGNEVSGMTITIENLATPTMSGGHVYLFGTLVPDYLSGKTWVALCVCNSAGNWVVTVTPSFAVANVVSSSQIQDTTIVNADIKDGTIALSKLVNLTRGSIIVGNASNVPAAVDFKTSGNIPIGDGTTLNSVAITGDITLSSGGVTDIVAATVGINEISSTIAGNGLQGGSGSSLSVKPNTVDGTSLTTAANGLSLTNDANSPGNNKFYGTNSSGVKGWQSIPNVSFEVTITIGTAEVLTLNGSHVLAIAAPGLGKAIVVEDAVMYINYVSATYAANTTLQVITKGADIAQKEGTNFLATSKTVAVKLNDTGVTDKTQIISNQGVEIMAKTGNPTTGDSDVVVYIKYRIINL